MQHPFPQAVADQMFGSPFASVALFAHPAWQQARAATLEALGGGGTTVLVGPPGSGKSSLVEELARTLREAGNPVRSVEQVRNSDSSSDGVLLVDDADGLSNSELAQLCASPAPVLLAALPGFEKRITWHTRPIRCVVLGRLSPQDVGRYVVFKLAAAGRPRGLLEPEAVLALARHSGGLMRLVNTLGGTAVFLAGLEDTPQVALRHVDEAASMHDDIGGDTALLFAAEPALDAPVLGAPAPTPTGGRDRLLGRRAALSTAAVAASGVLFALPWLGRRLQSAGPSAAQTSAPPAIPDVAVVAESGGTRQFTTDSSALQAESSALQAGPEAVPLPAMAPQPPVLHARSGRRAEKPPTGASTKVQEPLLAADEAVLFQGPIYNETLGQGGYVTLLLRKQQRSGAITARFNASQGLLGSGVLIGSLSEMGHLAASGPLLVGRNSFMCGLTGTIAGERLTGTADFTRSGRWAARSTFTLSRA